MALSSSVQEIAQYFCIDWAFLKMRETKTSLRIWNAYFLYKDKPEFDNAPHFLQDLGLALFSACSLALLPWLSHRVSDGNIQMLSIGPVLLHNQGRYYRQGDITSVSA